MKGMDPDAAAFVGNMIFAVLAALVIAAIYFYCEKK